MSKGFKQWLLADEWGDPKLLEGMVALHLMMSRYWEAGGEPITMARDQMDLPLKYPGKHLDKILPPAAPGEDRIIKGPDQNFLIPIDSIPQVSGSDPKKSLSQFTRDQPYIGAFSQANPENMASAIIFVLLTIRADFMQVMHSFPLIMTMLMSKFGNMPVTDDQLKQAMFDMEGSLAAKSKSSVVTVNAPTNKNPVGKVFRQGYGNGGQLFGTKYLGVAWVWTNRQQVYGTMMSMVAKKDTVGLFKYICTHIKGIAQPKAGFCCQLIFGELGCIDMHNVNLYSQYYLDRGQPRSKNMAFQPDTMKGNQMMRAPVGQRDLDAYTSLNPKSFSPPIKNPGLKPTGAVSSRDMTTHANRTAKFNGAVKSYMDVLKTLEQDGFNTIKLWDIWVSYVSKAYNKENGSSRYARDGKLAGNPMDPENDPIDAKIMKTRGPIPDRNTILTAGRNVVWHPDPETGTLVPYKKNKKTGEEKKLASYSVAGMDKEDSAGAASLSHGAIHWWRNPDYWWDLIHQANGERAKDGVRYASDQWAGPVSDVPRALPYLDTNPEMLNSLFPDDKERKEFKHALKDVLAKHDFYNVKRSDKPTRASRYLKHKIKPPQDDEFDDE